MNKNNLPKKIFNRTTNIDFNAVIHETRNGNTYHFIGNRKYRKKNQNVIYTVPNNKNPKCPNLKGIQKEELDEMWKLLRETGSLSKKETSFIFKELSDEGSCYFAAFCGIVTVLFPNRFETKRGLITLIP